jgi:hypothetical protein
MKILLHCGLCQTGHCARFVLSAKLQPAGMPMSVQCGDDRWVCLGQSAKEASKGQITIQTELIDVHDSA